MSLTAYLAPTLLSGLSDVSVSPGTAINGYPLTWDNTQGRWVASLLQISNLTGGPLPLSQGGTGSNNGSIAGTGVLTFSAGGANQNISLLPTGTGAVVSSKSIQINLSNSENNFFRGFRIDKGNGFFYAANLSSELDKFALTFAGRATRANTPGLTFQGLYPDDLANVDNGGCSFLVSRFDGAGPIAQNFTAFTFFNRISPLLKILGNGNATFLATTPSTSATSGALVVSGGAGIAGAIYNGGDLVSSGAKINFVNLPTTDVGLAVGDLWRDGNTVKVKV